MDTKIQKNTKQNFLYYLNPKNYECFYFNRYKWTNWLQFASVVIALATYCMIWASVIIDITLSKGADDVIWWNCLQFFTQQSNILVIIFMISLWLFPKSKAFGNQTFVTLVTGYITITFLIFNIILLPAKLSDGGYDAFGWANNAFIHVINPISCVIFFFVRTSTNKEPISKWYKCILIGMIYPTIYIIYAAILPFISNHSVYGTFTNLNPNLGIISGGKEVFGSINNIMWFIIVWVAFIVVIALYWWFSFWRAQDPKQAKKINSKQTINNKKTTLNKKK